MERAGPRQDGFGKSLNPSTAHAASWSLEPKQLYGALHHFDRSNIPPFWTILLVRLQTRDAFLPRGFLALLDLFSPFEADGSRTRSEAPHPRKTKKEKAKPYAHGTVPEDCIRRTRKTKRRS